MTITDRRTAYHWLTENLKSGSGSERAWKLGEERIHKAKKLIMCVRGYHSSPTPFDGLKYAPGPILCEVEIEDISDRGGHTDKDVSRIRKLIRYVNVEKELRLFACDCAERILTHQRKIGHEPDPRSWATVKASRDFVAGLITKEDLATAATAAHDVATAAYAAYAAYYSTAAYDAATAAYDAYDAATAAYDAYYSTALQSGEIDWQRQHFNKIMIEALSVNPNA